MVRTAVRPARPVPVPEPMQRQPPPDRTPVKYPGRHVGTVTAVLRSRPGESPSPENPRPRKSAPADLARKPFLRKSPGPAPGG